MLIEQSIAKQYGILPSDQGDLRYSDWAKLVSGLMPDTPLGRIVALRSENNKDIIKNMTPEQKAVRSEWRHFQFTHKQLMSKEDMEIQMKQLEKMFASAFGK